MSLAPPSTAADRRALLPKVAADLAASLGRAPSHAELADALGCNPRTIGRDLRYLADSGTEVPTRQDAEMIRAAERRAVMPQFIREFTAKHNGRAPTQADLAAHFGIARRAVQVDLDFLESEALIQVDRRNGQTVWITAR